jgi:peptidoglycan glycosyltransferase
MLGNQALSEIIADWELTGTQVTGIQSAQPVTASVALTDTQALRQFAVGQGSLTVTPLQMALAASTLAARGQMPTAGIVSATQSIDGMWQPVERPWARKVLPRDIADRIVAVLSHTDDIVWHAGEGLSGSSRLLWFIGMAPVERPKYAIAVLVETSAGVLALEQSAAEIGQELLSALPR